jgi:hypothetical protein
MDIQRVRESPICRHRVNFVCGLWWVFTRLSEDVTCCKLRSNRPTTQVGMHSLRRFKEANSEGEHYEMGTNATVNPSRQYSHW